MLRDKEEEIIMRFFISSHATISWLPTEASDTTYVEPNFHVRIALFCVTCLELDHCKRETENLENSWDCLCCFPL